MCVCVCVCVGVCVCVCVCVQVAAKSHFGNLDPGASYLSGRTPSVKEAGLLIVSLQPPVSPTKSRHSSSLV